MNNRKNIWYVAGVVALVAVIAALTWYTAPARKQAADTVAVRTTIESFGLTMKGVALGGRATDARAAIEANYTAYVMPELLAQWLANPASAPGIHTAGVSPDRIGIAVVSEQGRGRIVSGEIILITTGQAGGDGIETVPFIAQVIPTDAGWRIAAYQEETVQTLKKLPLTDEDIPGAR